MMRHRVCLIASPRFPVRDPFAGGLEAHTAMLAKELVSRGHDVTLFAAPGSAVGREVRTFPVAAFRASEAARHDANAVPEEWVAEQHAYLDLLLALAREGAERFDVVHNNGSHPLPAALAGLLPVPVVTTLHTPPVGWVESAAALARDAGTFVAVSRHTQSAWAHALDSTVVLNGVDTDVWRPGPGGDSAVWIGRVVPEKAPHLAIDACRAAGIRLQLAGPVQDEVYFETEVRPRLGHGAHFLGHLAEPRLVELLGTSSVAVVTPQWDEPFGLVAAEALACGTPVAAVARGGIPEVVSDEVGALAEDGDPDLLSEAVTKAVQRDRATCRTVAEQRLSAERMTSEYLGVYATLVAAS